MKQVLNKIYVLIGFLSLGIGIVGIVLPILPTTPFLLLALCLFAKGSERFHTWFKGTSLYKKHLEPVLLSKEMTQRAKIKAILTLTVLFSIGAYFCPIWHGKVTIIVVALGHFYYFLVKIKTKKER